MWLKDFVQNWRTGVRMVIAMATLGGLCIVSGMLGALLVFGFIVVLPAELFFHARIDEHYFVIVAIVGAGLWGVAMLGRSKSDIIGAMTEK